jgi:Ca-activated chloride channel homolog
VPKRHCRRPLVSVVFLLTLSGSFASASRAQDSLPVSQTPLTVSTELVFISASVIDGGGNFVGGLTRQNFRVLDNGTPQPIVFFAPVEAPAQVAVVVETSPAVYLIQNQHLVAAYALLNGLAADDQVTLFTYDQSPREVLPMTADKSAFLAALNTMQFTIGMADLNLYDSISTVLDRLGSEPGKRELVVLSTGLDSSPASHWDELVEKLHHQDAVIFTVALGGGLRSGSGKDRKKAAQPPSAVDEEFARADRALRSLAEITGGRAYFPRSEADFVPIYREIATVLRHQYLVGIAPQHDGQLHTLTVEPLDSQGQPMNAAGKKPVVRVFARQGYSAPSQ